MCNKSNKLVSIIIPSFNRAELLEFTLLSLFEQTITPQQFEVIVVDDCSTDQTLEVVRQLNPPYRLKLLHNNSNQGAAYSRNAGINASRGDIIIFLDEMLVDSNFIKGHLQYHQERNVIVSTHFNGRRIFSHYYKSFSRRQRLVFRSFISNRLRRDLYSDGIIRLFSKEEIINHKALSYGFSDKKIVRWYENLKESYGPNFDEMATPWFSFITNGVSLSRDLIYKAGLFDDRLKGAWMEDWELGYRLNLVGAKFINAANIGCYHQTHPITRKLKARLVNCLYFSQKHPSMEILLIPTMSALFNWSVATLAKVITQYKQLENFRNKAYHHLLAAFRDLARVLQNHASAIIKEKGLPPLKSFQRGFKRWDIGFASEVESQLQLLEQTNFIAYREFIQGFKDLLRLPIY